MRLCKERDKQPNLKAKIASISNLINIKVFSNIKPRTSMNQSVTLRIPIVSTIRCLCFKKPSVAG